MTAPTFRFAPSPNGELHLGHAYSALLNGNLAKKFNGRLLLRIEDIDITRCTPEFERGIYCDLEWLGLEWEQPVRRQSDHFADYGAALERLKRDGFVYPSFMSRGEVRGWIAEQRMAGAWPHDPDGAPHYPPLDRELTEKSRREHMDSGKAFAWRLNMDAAIGTVGTLDWSEFDVDQEGIERRITARPQEWGDVVLARSDIPTSYHLSVVVDDALQGVTHVVRGRDLYEATSVQRVLHRLLGLAPPVYHHHRLIEGADGRKLSKSARSTGLRALREAGCSPDDVKRMVGII
ncbi:MAG: tRNA glutamyl-Q(34) synthetase GluQRS [Rhizobiaceae bacterium]|nr:tRNA glutamyl-Q(34) synthetase GluQRS [Rhizobiaceae bacterium]